MCQLQQELEVGCRCSLSLETTTALHHKATQLAMAGKLRHSIFRIFPVLHERLLKTGSEFDGGGKGRLLGARPVQLKTAVEHSQTMLSKEDSPDGSGFLISSWCRRYLFCRQLGSLIALKLSAEFRGVQLHMQTMA